MTPQMRVKKWVKMLGVGGVAEGAEIKPTIDATGTVPLCIELSPAKAGNDPFCPVIRWSTVLRHSAIAAVAFVMSL